MLDGLPLLAADEVQAIDPRTGTVRWTYGSDADLAGAVAVGDRAYTSGGRIAALTSSGTEEWRYDNGGWVSAWSDDYLFGSRADTRLFALSMRGHEQWTTERPGEHFTLEAATESVVAGYMEDTVYAFDHADGSERYTFQVEGDHVTRLAATSNRLILGDGTGVYGLSG